MADYLLIKNIMKRKIKITLRQLKNLLSVSEMRPTQSITIIMDGVDKEELADVMKILSRKKKV